MSALALLYMAVLPLLKKRYKEKWLYYTWLVIVIGLIIPFRPQLENAVIRIDIHENTNITIPTTTPPAAQLQIDIPLLGTNEFIESNYTRNTPTKAGVPWETIMILAWITGIFSFLTFHIIRHSRFVGAARRWGEDITDGQILALWKAMKTKTGVTKQIRLQQCDFIGSPLLTGVLHPRILLPKRNIPDDALSYIFKHELFHFKRKDLWYKSMVLLSTAIHWFNPIVYFMAKAINTHCESSCDDDVIKGADTEARRQYGEALIGAICRSKLAASSSTNFYGGKKAVKNRIASIMDTSKKRAGTLILCILTLAAAITGVAVATSTGELQSAPEALYPTAPGTAVQQGAYGWIDYSNMSEGYITVAYTGDGSRRAKCQIKLVGKDFINYDLPNDGTPAVLPFAQGDGTYRVGIYQQAKGTTYEQVINAEVNVSLRTDHVPFLYPTQLMSYTKDSKCVEKAAELCKNAKNDVERLGAIYTYIIENIRYDREFALHAQSGYIPDPDQILERASGISFDYASLMGAMLRSQGIPTRMIIGDANLSVDDHFEYHAWNEVYLEDEGWTLMDATIGAIPQNAGMAKWFKEPTVYKEERRY